MESWVNFNKQQIKSIQSTTNYWNDLFKDVKEKYRDTLFIQWNPWFSYNDNYEEYLKNNNPYYKTLPYVNQLLSYLTTWFTTNDILEKLRTLFNSEEFNEAYEEFEFDAPDIISEIWGISAIKIFLTQDWTKWEVDFTILNAGKSSTEEQLENGLSPENIMFLTESSIKYEWNNVELSGWEIIKNWNYFIDLVNNYVAFIYINKDWYLIYTVIWNTNRHQSWYLGRNQIRNSWIAEKIKELKLPFKIYYDKKKK